MAIGWFLLAVWLLVNGGRAELPSLPDWFHWPAIIAPEVATAAVYIYEKDNGGVPAPVSAALSELNAKGLRATTFEKDDVDGSGEVPEQYRVALPAAKEAGLPALVVMAGDKVRIVVKAPATFEAVIEAAR